MCGLFAQRPSTAAKNDEIVPPARSSSSSCVRRHRPARVRLCVVESYDVYHAARRRVLFVVLRGRDGLPAAIWFERHRDLTGLRRRRDRHAGRGRGGGFHHELGRRGRWAVGHASVEYFARLRARARPDQMDSVGSATSLREESSDSVARSEL